MAPGLDRRRAAGAPGAALRKSGYGDDLLRPLAEKDAAATSLAEVETAREALA